MVTLFPNLAKFKVFLEKEKRKKKGLNLIKVLNCQNECQKNPDLPKFFQIFALSSTVARVPCARGQKILLRLTYKSCSV